MPVLGNNNQSAPWHVVVSPATGAARRWKFYAGYETEAEARAIAADRTAGVGRDAGFEYQVRANGAPA